MAVSEKIKEYLKQRYKNPNIKEKIKESQRKWREKNLEYLKEYSKNYTETNRQKINEKCKLNNRKRYLDPVNKQQRKNYYEKNRQEILQKQRDKYIPKEKSIKITYDVPTYMQMYHRVNRERLSQASKIQYAKKKAQKRAILTVGTERELIIDETGLTASSAKLGEGNC